jgi:acyl-CoA synthetase (AMP-forming)/AMP-acid ligase II
MSSTQQIFRSPHGEIAIPALSLSEFVLGSTRARAEHAALADGISGRVITYGELREQVRCVAAGLAELGIRKGDVVALFSPNLPEFAVAFHAVVRLGATVTPANPANTARELAHQFKDAGARLCITVASLSDKARAAAAECGHAIDVITIDEAPGFRSFASIARDVDPPTSRCCPTPPAPPGYPRA